MEKISNYISPLFSENLYVLIYKYCYRQKLRLSACAGDGFIYSVHECVKQAADKLKVTKTKNEYL